MSEARDLGEVNRFQFYDHLKAYTALPADDRRHFVAWSDLTKEHFNENYWNALWRWYDKQDGDRHVTAYLADLDLSDFDPKAPPPKTAAFWDIVDANRSPEDAELADVIDQLGNPDAVTLIQIANRAEGDFANWLKDRKNRRVNLMQQGARVVFADMAVAVAGDDEIAKLMLAKHLVRLAREIEPQLPLYVKRWQ